MRSQPIALKREASVRTEAHREKPQGSQKPNAFLEPR
jgi:hypothetical protein